MKSLLKNIFLITLLVNSLFIVGCKKQLDINTDPNNPPLENGSPLIVFPAAVIGTAGAVGGEYAILGGIWGEYVTQSALSNQYKTIDAYQLKKSDLNGGYSLLYTRGIKNFQYVIDKARDAQDWSFYLMGTAMKAYATTVLVDLYDQIPYFEALQGLKNLNPKFDDGYTIYKDLLDSLDTALGKDLTPPLLTPAEEAADLIFNRDTDKWRQFAYTLELKMYLRMINAKPAEAAAGITKLYNTNGVSFLDVDAGLFGFTDAPGSDNPMYEQNIRQLNTPDNIRASFTFTSFLELNADPRIVYYFNNSAPTAIHQGDYASSDPSYRTAAVLVERPTDPVIFISRAESYFMQAEAKARFNAGTASAKELYDAGVLAAFSATGNNGTAFITGAYKYPSAGSLEQKIEAISVQKWISCAYGVHFLEGFFERNRTGYPQTSPVYSTDADYVPGQFVISANSSLAADKFPKRLVIPDLERQTNSNTPTEVPIDVPVWWAK